MNNSPMMSKDVKDLTSLIAEAKQTILKDALLDSSGQWKSKGRVLTDQTIIPFTNDTKAISHFIESDMVDALEELLKKNGYRIERAPNQNTYPDLTVHLPQSGRMVAIDIKTTYRTTATEIHGFTLGAFSGYFRTTGSTKNSLYAYNQYSEHLVVGVIYDRLTPVQTKRRFAMSEIAQIKPAVSNLEVISWPKYAIASGLPGSGNTKNIGALKNIELLRSGQSEFVTRAHEVDLSPAHFFEMYWQNYHTRDMRGDAAGVYSTIEGFIQAEKSGPSLVRALSEATLTAVALKLKKESDKKARPKSGPRPKA